MKLAGLKLLQAMPKNKERQKTKRGCHSLNEKDIVNQEAEEELGYILPGELKPHERKDDE